MPGRALVGALKRTRVGTDDSASASSPSARASESKQCKRSVTFGAKHAFGTADAAVDRTPHGEPPRCGGCGLLCLGRLYACKTCERRVSMETLEVGMAFDARVSRAFNLCTVCFSAHVRVALGASGAKHARGTDAAKRAASDVSRDVDAILGTFLAVEAERRDAGGAHEEVTVANVGDGDDSRASPPSPERSRDASATSRAEDASGSEGSTVGDDVVGVHEHSPYEFTRRNDADQQMLDAMAEEKRRFKLERGEREDVWVDSGDDDSEDEASSEAGVSVGEVAFRADAASDAKPRETTWDYASELI